MKVWITKYALTRGIIKENIINDEIEGNGYGIYFERNGLTQGFYGNDWHETKPEAINRAKEMQAKKIKSLERQLKKIRRLKF